MRFKKWQNLMPLPKKISEYAPDIKTFSKGLFTPVSVSKRLLLS